MNYVIVAGTTGNLQFQLLEGGNPINLTGCTVILLLNDCNGNAIASPGTITVIDPTNGKVQLTPASTSTFSSGTSPYMARWEVTTGGSQIFYVPTGPRDTWEIVGI